MVASALEVWTFYTSDSLAYFSGPSGHAGATGFSHAPVDDSIHFSLGDKNARKPLAERIGSDLRLQKDMES